MALSDLTKSVEKNEERIAKYVYARGLVRACLDNPQQALNDFTIVLSWDSKFAEAYLNRAKVFTILGDRTSAFNDL
jgi:tetratricopeptide (TPR) repeat protein